MSSAGQQLVAGRIPGERIGTTIVTSDSSNFTTTETTVMSVTVPLVDGRTYAIYAYPKFASSVDNDDITANIREDNVSGTGLQQDSYELVNDTQSTRGMSLPMYAEYTASATGNKTFVVSAVRAAGTGNIRLEAAADKPSYLFVEYISG